MKKIISILLLLVFINNNICLADANHPQPEREYVKLIEEGKTWEYIHSYRTWDWFTLTAFQMRFDGTEIRNGKEYHKLIYCGDLTKWKADIHGEYECWWKDSAKEISSQPNDIAIYFLMREENGKVYLYIKDLIEGNLNPEDVVDITEEIIERLGDETIIYDFTKRSGEAFNNVFCNILDTTNEIYPLLYAWWAIMDFNVKSTSLIEMNGKQLIFQNISYHSFERYTCIEGVGVITSGFLPYIDCSPIQSGMTFTDYYLNRLIDVDGEIIYKADEECYIDVAKIIELADMDYPNVAPFIARNGCDVKAENAEITLYDLSGRVMYSGFETVSTSSLQPGVYVAKAQAQTGISTLKLKVD